MKTLKSNRLVLRPFKLSDALDLFEYAKRDDVGPRAGWKPHEDVSESKRIIELFIEKDEVYAIVLKEEKKVIGSVGIHYTKLGSLGKVYELGFVLHPKYHRLGLMTEAVTRILDEFFSDPSKEKIYVGHFVENDPSRKLIEKFNFDFVEDIDYKSRDYGDKESKIYQLNNEKYRMRRSSRMKKWSLNKLYLGFDDAKFKEDLDKLDRLILEINSQSIDFKNYEKKTQKLERYLRNEMALNDLVDKLYHFASLTSSVESTNQEANKMVNLLQTKLTQLTEISTLFVKWMKDYPKLSEDLKKSDLLNEHTFYLKEVQEKARHLLSTDLEVMISKLRQTGSSSWGKLQSLLTSTLDVEYDGSTITLSEVRNLATDKNSETRRKAYEAEIKAYEKIEDSIAFALNSIKGEVNTISKARAFKSPLDQALNNSRMEEKTLEAMQSAVVEYYDIFRQYLKRKAKLLGHKNGLPFYDLFAPIGENDTTFSIQEANAYILKNFKTFSPKLHDLARRAFDEEWVDYTPRKGKRGGAFCANMQVIKESRIMTNFTGSFSDMITLSHELGHAYHGDAIFDESNLNSSYTMPVAETASTFCETIVNNAAINDVNSEEEKIYLLESSIQDYTQVVIDIMSRFIFEKSVFEGRETTVFDASELKDLMIDAQKQTYGDGLDENTMHPYMWICKPHYYSGGLSYYNFPYTYGLLFAKGLYAKYLENKDGFVKVYDNLLAATGKMTVEEVARLANIDVSKKDFWKSSLELLKKDIELFLELTD